MITASSFKSKQLERRRIDQIQFLINSEPDIEDVYSIISRETDLNNDFHELLIQEEENQGSESEMKKFERKKLDNDCSVLEGKRIITNKIAILNVDFTCIRNKSDFNELMEYIDSTSFDDCENRLNNEESSDDKTSIPRIKSTSRSNAYRKSPVQMYYMMGKPFCFLEFDTEKPAIKFFERWEKAEFDGKLFMLEYVKMIPQSFVDIIEKLKRPLPLEFSNAFRIYEDILTVQEESELLKRIWELDDWEILKKRRVTHFGQVFNYRTNQVDKERIRSIPNFLCPLLERASKLHSQVHEFDQLTINEYDAGAGIAPHVDVHSSFDEEIWIISLGSRYMMEFKDFSSSSTQLSNSSNIADINNYDHNVKFVNTHPRIVGHDEIIEVDLPARSLMVMTKSGRYGWTHGIRPRKFDLIKEGFPRERGTRISLTFRKVNEKRICQCSYPRLCDYQKEKNSNKEISNLLDK